MRTRNYYLWLFFLAISLNVSAQNKLITLKDIWTDYAFYPSGMTNLSALKNTNQYTVLNYDYTNLNYTIDLYKTIHRFSVSIATPSTSRRIKS